MDDQRHLVLEDTFTPSSKLLDFLFSRAVETQQRNRRRAVRNLGGLDGHYRDRRRRMRQSRVDECEFHLVNDVQREKRQAISRFGDHILAIGEGAEDELLTVPYLGKLGVIDLLHV